MNALTIGAVKGLPQPVAHAPQFLHGTITTVSIILLAAAVILGGVAAVTANTVRPLPYRSLLAAAAFVFGVFGAFGLLTS